MDEQQPQGASARQIRELDASALRALAHPLRVRIFDILSQYGPQTASTLAARLGESSGSTSYHLRALAHHELIQEVEGRGTARERWWERPEGSVTLTSPESMKTPAGRAATQLVMSEFLRRRHAQLLHFVESRMLDEAEPWREAGVISTNAARLTPAQSQELALTIMTIIDETVEKYRHQEGDEVRPVTIRADIFPLPELLEESP